MAENANSMPVLMELPWKKQLALMLLVLERMLPLLIAFSKDTGRDAACYLKARDAAWAALEGKRDGLPNELLNEECLRNAPDTEEFSHKLTSYALDAALAMSHILEFIVDRQKKHIADVLVLAVDSVDLFVGRLDASFVYTPELERKIAAHPLMKQELRREAEDIKFLAGLPDEFDKETISALRTRASSQAPLLPVPR